MSFDIDLRIKSIDLSNFRCFEQLHLDLDPRCTLIFGANGRGKTAILEAITAGLGALFSATENVKWQGPLLSGEDRRVVIREAEGVSSVDRPTPVSVRIDADLEGAPVSWMVTPRSRQSVRGSAAGRWGAEMEKRVGLGDPITLPVVAYYWASRTWEAGNDFSDDSPGSRMDAYADCLKTDETLIPVTAWMRRLTYAGVQRGNVSPHLDAVRAAVLSAMPELTDFFFDISAEDLRVRYQDSTLQSVRLLSDGYRNLLGMTADLAWRVARLNPHRGVDAAKVTRGVVLIDEIDLHLHPTWQRRVLPGLVAGFPMVQFIITTHSPQVLGSAKREWTRVIDGDGRVFSGAYVEGRDSNSILTDVMGDRGRDPGTQDKLNTLFRSIDREEFEEARSQIADLAHFLGPDDIELVRAEALLTTLEAADADDHQGY